MTPPPGGLTSSAVLIEGIEYVPLSRLVLDFGGTVGPFESYEAFAEWLRLGLQDKEAT
jgi:hypothetical protein